MTSFSQSTSTQSSGIRYSQATLQRADRAVRCAPFSLRMYVSMIAHSVSIKAMAGMAGIRSGYTQRAISELGAETELLWLMQVGLLRREVDGQGLTDSFRITPLGRQLVERWHNIGAIEGSAVPTLSASWRDRFFNALSRWFRLPF